MDYTAFAFTTIFNNIFEQDIFEGCAEKDICFFDYFTIANKWHRIFIERDANYTKSEQDDIEYFLQTNYERIKKEIINIKK